MNVRTRRYGPRCDNPEPNGQPHDALFGWCSATPTTPPPNSGRCCHHASPPVSTSTTSDRNQEPSSTPNYDTATSTCCSGRPPTTATPTCTYSSNTSAHPTQRWHLRMMTYQTRIWGTSPHHRRNRGLGATAAGIIPSSSTKATATDSRHRHRRLIDNDLKADAGDLLPHVRYLVDDLTLLDDAALRARPSPPQPASLSWCSPGLPATTTSPPGSTSGSTTSSA